MKKISARDDDSMEEGPNIYTPEQEAVLIENGFWNYDENETEYSFFGREVSVAVPQLSYKQLYPILEGNLAHVDYRGDKTPIPNEPVKIRVTIEKDSQKTDIETFVTFNGLPWSEDGGFGLSSDNEDTGVLGPDVLSPEAPLEEVLAKANEMVAQTRAIVLENALTMQSQIVKKIINEAGVSVDLGFDEVDPDEDMYDDLGDEDE